MSPKTIAFIAVVLLITGCATASKINNLQVGMTKDQVIKTMGKPASISAKGGTEYLNYSLSETDDHAFYGITTPYYVRLINGTVDAYGRMGDFDSTKPTTVRIESKEEISQEIKSKPSNDMYTDLIKLKELKDSGVLSNEEFESQKKKILEKY